MRGNAELSAWGAEAAAGAAAVIVGSEHIRSVVEEVCGPVERVHAVPPGVDIDVWQPQSRADALAGLLAEARLDPPNPGNADERLPDENNAERLAEFLAGDAPTVVYFGKLIENKGVQVLIDGAAGGRLPRRDRRLRPGARAVRAPGRGPAGALHRSARAPPSDSPVRARRRRRGAVDLPRGVRDGGRRGRRCRLPAGRGAPLGPGRVAEGLERFYPAGMGRLASFPSGDAAELAERLRTILALPDAERDELRAAARAAVVELWSWKSVAERILAASIAPAP